MDESYSTVNFKDSNLHNLLTEWHQYYNWYRPHRPLGGNTPIERLNEHSDKNPPRGGMVAKFDPSNEHIQEQNYRNELTPQKLK